MTGIKKVLIVVDMQNDFIDGTLGTPEAIAIVPAVKRKIQEYEQDPTSAVVFTRDTHDMEYLETQEGRNLPVPHCIKGSHGWAIRKELLDEVKEASIIDKSAFGWPCWQQVFGDGDNLAIELVGLCTDICVVSNALVLKAFYPEVPLTVDAACCAGVTSEKHEAALSTMESCQIHIMNH